MSYKEQVAGLLAKANKYRRLARTVSDQEIVGRISDLSDDLEKQAQQLNRMLREETIRSRAHQIWEEHNCPAGRDEEFWLQAERELDGGSSQRRSSVLTAQSGTLNDFKGWSASPAGLCP